MWSGWLKRYAPRCGLSRTMLKRGFDLLVAVAALALLAPLLLGLALWIKLDSTGPVLFRQQRVGRYGRLFSIHKFRTMVADAPARGPQITVGNDARITRAGAYLRRSKLDELPQLFDVLAGHMSLVGPRPEVPVYVALYPAALRDKVLAVRPGITDPTSLDFVDENALLARSANPEREYIEVLLPIKLHAAAAYAEHATLASDLRVIGHTLQVLWTRMFTKASA
jgi:lipopolysaccharide/colanic/teichoic acid biosynthesis glycosyltransferase